MVFRLPLSGLVTRGQALHQRLYTRNKLLSDKRRYTQRRRRYEMAVETYQEARAATRLRIEQVGHIRLNSLTTLARAVEFLSRARLRYPQLFQELDIDSHELAHWEAAATQADVSIALTSGPTVGVTGVPAIYGWISALGAASDGDALSALIGGLPSNAALAYLAGGSVAAGGGGMALDAIPLNNMLVGPAPLGDSLFSPCQTDEIAGRVAGHVAQMDISEADLRSQLCDLWSVFSRVDELCKCTTQLAHSLHALLSRADPANRADAASVWRLAQAVAEMLTRPVLGKCVYPWD